MDVGARLRMDGDVVGAGLGERIEEIVDRRDHEVYVERLLGVGAKRLHHGRADRQVGHEMAVHHVDVDPVGARFVDRPHVLAKLREVGGQDRGRDERHGSD